MTDIAAKLPDMEDAALTVLRANAERLEQTGTKAQRAAASALIPAIEAELEARRAAKPSQAAAKLSQARRAREAAGAPAPKRRTKRKSP